MSDTQTHCYILLGTGELEEERDGAIPKLIYGCASKIFFPRIFSGVGAIKTHHRKRGWRFINAITYGWKLLKGTANQAGAFSMERKILTVWRTIPKEANAKIIFIGSSRGAFSAQILAQILGHHGYAGQDAKTIEKRIKRRETPNTTCNAEVSALYGLDPVGAHIHFRGIHPHRFMGFLAKKFAGVKHARIVLMHSEKRVLFQPNIYDDGSTTEWTDWDLKQVWFRGVHADAWGPSMLAIHVLAYLEAWTDSPESKAVEPQHFPWPARLRIVTPERTRWLHPTLLPETLDRVHLATEHESQTEIDVTNIINYHRSYKRLLQEGINYADPRWISFRDILLALAKNNVFKHKMGPAISEITKWHLDNEQITGFGDLLSKRQLRFGCSDDELHNFIRSMMRVWLAEMNHQCLDQPRRDFMFQFANDSDVELCTDIQDVVRTIVQTLSRSGPAMPDEMIYLDYQERRGWRGPKRITKNLLSQLNRDFSSRNNENDQDIYKEYCYQVLIELFKYDRFHQCIENVVPVIYNEGTYNRLEILLEVANDSRFASSIGGIVESIAERPEPYLSEDESQIILTSAKHKALISPISKIITALKVQLPSAGKYARQLILDLAKIRPFQQKILDEVVPNIINVLISKDGERYDDDFSQMLRNLLGDLGLSEKQHIYASNIQGLLEFLANCAPALPDADEFFLKKLAPRLNADHIRCIVGVWNDGMSYSRRAHKKVICAKTLSLFVKYANPNLRAEFKPSVQGLFEAMTDPDSQACRASINTLEIFLEYDELHGDDLRKIIREVIESKGYLDRKLTEGEVTILDLKRILNGMN